MIVDKPFRIESISLKPTLSTESGNTALNRNKQVNYTCMLII